MSADPAEAVYFDGAPLAHVVAYRERQRLARIAEVNRRAARAFDRARFDRLMYAVGFVDVTVDAATGDVLDVAHVHPSAVSL